MRWRGSRSPQPGASNRKTALKPGATTVDVDGRSDTLLSLSLTIEGTGTQLVRVDAGTQQTFDGVQCSTRGWDVSAVVHMDGQLLWWGPDGSGTTNFFRVPAGTHTFTFATIEDCFGGVFISGTAAFTDPAFAVEQI